MKRYFPVATGGLALCIEVTLFWALMEIPPFSKGDSDIIWGLPCFSLVIFALAALGILSAIALKNNPHFSDKLVTLGLALNGLALAIPILFLFLSMIRSFL